MVNTNVENEEPYELVTCSNHDCSASGNLNIEIDPNDVHGREKYCTYCGSLLEKVG